MSAALRIDGLTVETTDTATAIVSDVSLEVAPGEVLCVVGESGSGKSVTMLAALGLLDPALTATAGHVWLGETDLMALDESGLRRHRGRDVAMVFQDPMTTLNPVKRVGTQIARAVRVHQDVSRRQAFDRAVELLESVGVPDARHRARAYPHQWSGGMRQRAVIAMAMANSPSVLVADEPTTALDVTVQQQVMDVLRTAREVTGAALVMITHDLGLVAQVADRVAIMYAGRIVEQGTVLDIFERPAHPYTQGLLGSLLTAELVGRPAVGIEGSPPSPTARPAGCAFVTRCTAQARSSACHELVPALLPEDSDRQVACHHASVDTMEVSA